MFKKHKQLIIGFLLGALVFGIVPAGATIGEYILKKSEAKLMVDGVEFDNKELPVLNYQGYNYIPAATFREVCDTIGVGFEWVGEKNEIQINTNKEKDTSQIIEEGRVEQVEFVQVDGFELLLMDGVYHITPRQIHEYLVDNNLDYAVGYNREEMTYYIEKINDRRDRDKDEIMFQHIPMSYISNGKGYMFYDFFKNNILPVVKK